MNRKALFVTFLLVAAGSATVALRRGADGSVALCRPTAPAAPAPGPERVVAEGRVAARPGAEVVVGTDTGGTIASLLVNEKDRVVRGQLIARIDASVDERALEQARARVAEAEADLRLAEADRNRAEQLLASNVGSRQALEKAERDRDAAAARQATAAAEG